ncbi:MAG: molybdopterin molybdotransferase MoeA [Gammaproteobacteria bacterium]|nr:molybdopterin molybdotransferase MoeA [Gammaproteobacteria bacterium]
MLSEHEAIKTLLDHARILVKKETVSLSDANGRVCAVNIVAPINVPSSDNSAMDGFACNSADIPSQLSVSISQRVIAGSNPAPLKPATAARIFTGASLPQGADCVVIQEDCTYDNKTVLFKVTPISSHHVRYAGEDIQQGNVVLHKGDVIGAVQIGLIASLGINTVSVYQRLRIALLTTGNELLEPGTDDADIHNESGKRYNSNRYALSALINQLRFTVTHHKIVADNLSDTENELALCSKDADVIISTGGVSVGDEDYIKTALQNIGTMYLWKIAIKPGKPLVFGAIGDTPFIGLPGNPVSALITFLIIARPFLLSCQGLNSRLTNQALVSYSVIARFSWLTKNRSEYLRVKLIHQGGQLCAQAYSSQDSGIQSSLHHSDGLVRIEAGCKIEPGDKVDYTPYSALFNLPV